MPEFETKIPRQKEMILATVKGRGVTSLPEDLYVPPNALEIFLDSFAGPLDFLLYLIRKQNLNIVDIDVLEITKQYTSYIDLMEALQIELAGDSLVMAAYLAELKSRMLLHFARTISSTLTFFHVLIIHSMQSSGISS